MPYKSSDKQREANREIQRRKRQGVTDKGVTQQGVTLLKRPNGEGYDPSEMLGNRKRYMVMKDGQVLDRQTLPHLINDEVTNQGSPREDRQHELDTRGEIRESLQIPAMER